MRWGKYGCHIEQNDIAVCLRTFPSISSNLPRVYLLNGEGVKFDSSLTPIFYSWSDNASQLATKHS